MKCNQKNKRQLLSTRASNRHVQGLGVYKTDVLVLTLHGHISLALEFPALMLVWRLGQVEEGPGNSTCTIAVPSQAYRVTILQQGPHPHIPRFSLCFPSPGLDQDSKLDGGSDSARDAIPPSKI